MKVNDIIHGFKLLKIVELKEISGEGFLFEHNKTGARLFFIKTDDDNKVFSIAFRTPPEDDTGVAHILEHSVLCGSRKYPLKEPFVELVKGSLNTFLNAMTYPDKTVYPVASRNDKDFQNLMDVYLDAVFYPAIYNEKEIFMQEGWHYELVGAKQSHHALSADTSPSRTSVGAKQSHHALSADTSPSRTSLITLSGVVYNEMKGALSSPDSLLAQKIMKSLFPDTAYGFESGGDPASIPSLSYEKFLEFHKKYYHPSNSYIYLYGCMNIEEKLEYIDREYLSNFDKINVNSKIEKQKTFDALKREEYFYPVPMESEVNEKTFLSLNYITGDALDNETMLALQILEHALIGSATCPLKTALIDAKIGKDVDSNTENEILQPMFSIILSNSDKDKADKFLNIIDETLNKLATDGIDSRLLESAINLFEFRLREADFGTAPKGLIYGLASLRNWLYDGSPESPLMYEPLLARMREGLNTGYFENLIKKYFLENTHKTLVILTPSKTIGKEQSDALKAKLSKIKSNMTESVLDKIKEDNARLLSRQNAEETPEAINSIPILNLSDIRKNAYEYPLEIKDENGIKILYSDINTYGISYVTLLFNTDKVLEKDIFWIYLLESLLQNVPTKKHSYEELGLSIDLTTGGIDSDVLVITESKQIKNYTPYFKITGKSLIRKLPEMLNLMEEIILESEFTDKKRVQERLEEIIVDIEMSFERNAHNIVAEEIASYSSEAKYYAELGGLPFYRELKAFLKDFDNKFDSLSENMKRIALRVFNKENLKVAVTLKKEDYNTFANSFKNFAKNLPDNHFDKIKYNFKLEQKNEGLMSASQIQYVGKGGNFINLGHKYTGALSVLETILRYDYFWNNIRVKGGAYGAFSSFKRDGSLFFCSYRDPNLKETLDIFDRTVEFLDDFDVSDREMDKFIIGTMSHIDAPLTPKMKGEAAYLTYLQGITYEDRQNSRNEILSAKVKDIRALKPLIADVLKENNICVFGGEEVLKENKDIFKSLVNLFNL